jgi:hypothetical protein
MTEDSRREAMTEDSRRLLYIIRYAGSDAGKSAMDDFLIEVRALRKVAEAARVVVRCYPSYPSWGAAEHALHDTLEELSAPPPIGGDT